MYRIAVCDDDIQMQRFLCSAIEEAGIACTVEKFSNGAELLRDEKEYDILFLDIDMPVVNGMDAARQLRRRDRRAKIIYVTGYQDYMQRSFAVHPFSFLVKPVKRKRSSGSLGKRFCTAGRKRARTYCGWRPPRGWRRSRFRISIIWNTRVGSCVL